MKVANSKIERLICELNDHGERRPLQTVAKLARVGKAAFPPLVKALQTADNVRIRRWSAAALGAMGDKKAIGHLRKALHDPNMSVRLRAMLALEDLNDPQLGRRLIPLLKDSSGGVRVNAVDAIARIQFRGAAKQLVVALKDEKWYVRRAAAQAIASLQMSNGKAAVKTSAKRRKAKE